MTHTNRAAAHRLTGRHQARRSASPVPAPVVALVAAVVALLALLATPVALPHLVASVAPVVATEPIADQAADLVAIDAMDPRTEELRVALLEAGFRGDPADDREAIYAPVWMVLDVPGGTWTITPDGGARCVDWSTTGAECTDGVYLPWMPDYAGPAGR